MAAAVSTGVAEARAEEVGVAASTGVAAVRAEEVGAAAEAGVAGAWVAGAVEPQIRPDIACAVKSPVKR